MAMTSSAKVTTWILQAVFVGLCLGVCSYAQSSNSERLVARNTEIQFGKGYQKWLDEDVRWIISPEEKAAFANLRKDEERDQFVEQFWLRRDPTPGTPQNEYKEEHYRRLAYSNTHFAAGVPGWKTDRGRIYIVYGPPDQMKTQLAGSDSMMPTEVWHYQSIPGFGRDIDLHFVDTCNCGDYKMQIPRDKQNQPLRIK